MEPLHDLKFVEVTAIDAVQMEDIVLSSQACQECLNTYQENMRLVLGLASAPGWSAMVTMQWNMATHNAAVDVWGSDFKNKMEGATPSQVKQFQIGIHNEMRKTVQEDSPLQRRHLEVMTRQLNELAWRCGPFCHGMMEGILKTVWIQAWTAIEVLLEDLHTFVIRDHRLCFTPDIIEKHSNKKFKFRSRESFRKSYTAAFGVDSVISTTIHHESMDALAAVRNLLVHKAGIVDKMFINDNLIVAPSLNVFPVIREGKPLKFDGTIVYSIVNSAVSQAYKLLRDVDTWIQTRQQSASPPN